MPLQSTLSAVAGAWDALSSGVLSACEAALRSVPLVGERLVPYADIPAYGLLFLATNAAVVWPLHNTLRYMDAHPEGWWFKHKIEKVRKPPKELEEAAGASGRWGRIVVGPVQEAIVYAVLYRALKPTFGVSVPLGTMAKRIFGAMIWTDVWLYWYHRFVHTNKWAWRNLHREHHEFIVSTVYASYWGTRNEGFLQSSPMWTAPLVCGFTSVPEILLWMAMNEYINLHQHCGYSFPWDPLEYWPLAGSAHHWFHHAKNSGPRSGNYSLTFFSFWDTVFGTDKRYWVWLSRKAGEDHAAEDAAEDKEAMDAVAVETKSQ
ncbi:hypothetical protein DFJ74DRAFT_688332 [Hyaloraphidium curvatum]|nr:hypothetical protein DFJ74DRAFT_688332 [Hyaloraphidium curvatum]